jgi:hypothetical protein
VTTYRKRPVEVEACQYVDWTSLPALQDFVGVANLRTAVGKCQIWVEKSQAWCDVEFGGAAVAEPDGGGFYPITRGILEATYVEVPPNAERLPIKEVLVVRDATWEHGVTEQLAEATGLLVVELRDGATVESLDEAGMREHGWARHYLSTACQHGEHRVCRKVCKFCSERCRCDCHKDEPRAET